MQGAAEQPSCDPVLLMLPLLIVRSSRPLASRLATLLAASLGRRWAGAQPSSYRWVFEPISSMHA
jgi:hypothetical protein